MAWCTIHGCHLVRRKAIIHRRKPSHCGTDERTFLWRRFSRSFTPSLAGKRARSKNEETVKSGVEGVETHQLVLVFLKAAMEGRWALCEEVWRALTNSEKFSGSEEELTPISLNDLLGLCACCWLEAELRWRR